jgi:hypothetical protein
MTKVLIYGGKTGWIGGMMFEMLQKEGEPSTQSAIALVCTRKLSLLVCAR